MERLPLKFVVGVTVFYGVSLIVILLSLPYIRYTTDSVLYDLHPEWHPRSRSERFPSVEERVQLYMSSWYHYTNEQKQFYYSTERNINTNDDNPSILHVVKAKQVSSTDVSNNNNIAVLGQQQEEPETYRVPATMKRNTLVYLEPAIVKQCALESKKPRSRWWFGAPSSLSGSSSKVRWNCADVVDLVDRTTAPVVAVFGNTATAFINPLGIPVFSKWRKSTPKQDKTGARAVVVPPSIIWKFDTKRQWDPLDTVGRYDSLWKDKHPRAVWRGEFPSTITATNQTSLDDSCGQSTRCRFVYRHAESMRIDAGFVHKRLVKRFWKGRRLVKRRLSMAQWLRFKIILSFEKTDATFSSASSDRVAARDDDEGISPHLKWALYSRSVVLMPPPTKTSWAMEELLQPWVHYVPLSVSENGGDGDNTEEMIEWVLQHDTEAQRIAERATLFIHDMLYHPEAIKDETQVKEQMIQHYQQHWHQQSKN